jgi:hypothetical protein
MIEFYYYLSIDPTQWCSFKILSPLQNCRSMARCLWMLYCWSYSPRSGAALENRAFGVQQPMDFYMYKCKFCVHGSLHIAGSAKAVVTPLIPPVQFVWAKVQAPSDVSTYGWIMMMMMIIIINNNNNISKQLKSVQISYSQVYRCVPWYATDFFYF